MKPQSRVAQTRRSRPCLCATRNQGRWFTPDPLGGDIMNPQSLNRYAYALNNPTTLTDPLGLDTIYCGSVAGRFSLDSQGNVPLMLPRRSLHEARRADERVSSRRRIHAASTYRRWRAEVFA